MSKAIQKGFDKIAKNYDLQRRRLIPCFDDFYGIATKLIESNCDMINILDIGAGTGLFSAFILNKYPKAKITLIDISEQMLEMAKERFDGNKNIKYIAANYTEYEFNDKYDVIISALSIHHLEHEQKKGLYSKCYEILKSNGIFINADQVLGETLYIEKLNKMNWEKSIEESSLTQEEIIATYERIKLDKEATLDEQLSWLKKSGFVDVGCVYKYFHFAVMFGRKF